MAISALTNQHSSFAQAQLGITQRSLTKALERLSSGIKINHANDDPAGFLFATQMSFTINGTNSGTANLNMAADLLNTADAFTRVITEDLQRMGELASQASNGLLTADQRAGLQQEFNELNSEIDRLASNASFNGKTILDGSLNGVKIQSGAAATDTVTISIGSLKTDATGLNTAALDISTVAGAQAAVQQINTSVQNVLSPTLAKIGAQAGSWLKSADAQDAYVMNLKSARSRVYDADFAEETSNLTNSQVRAHFGIAALSHSNHAQLLGLGLLA